MIRQMRFIVALGLLAWPLSAHAQQPTNVPRVGVLSDETASRGTIFDLIADGLRRLGWVEGQNIAFERRYADENEKAFRASPPSWSTFSQM